MVKIIMYRKIKQLKKQGKTNIQIKKETGFDAKTVKKYIKMNDKRFSDYLKKQRYRNKGFDSFKTDILSVYKANKYKKLVVSSVYDYLEEKNDDLPANEGSLRNYINYLIETKQLIFKKSERIYTKVDELSYGKQMQLDFGEYILPGGMKLFIFATLLSGSRYKYAAFQDHTFCAEDVILHLLDSFDFFGGIPEELVIDQDKTMVVSENNGDIIYTKDFKYFIEEMDLKMYVCRKADPESKGKIENMVKFIKQSFLNCRNFNDIDSANESLQKWLSRRANGKISQATKKIPCVEIEAERLKLRPIKNSIFRKDLQIGREERTASDKSRLCVAGCYYALPIRFKNKSVQIYITKTELFVYDPFDDKEIARYQLSSIPGELVADRSIIRESTEKIETLKESAITLQDFKEWTLFLEKVFKDKPRYCRDQCIEAKNHFSEIDDVDILKKAVVFCLENKSLSMGQLSDTYTYFKKEKINETKNINMPVLTKTKSNIPDIKIEIPSFDVYNNIIEGVTL